MKVAGDAMRALVHHGREMMTHTPEMLDKARDKYDDIALEALVRSLELAETGSERAKEVASALEIAWNHTIEGIKEVAERPEARRAWHRTKSKGTAHEISSPDDFLLLSVADTCRQSGQRTSPARAVCRACMLCPYIAISVD